MRRATALLVLALAAFPIWPIPIPAVPSHDDKLGFAPLRGIVTPCCQNTITLKGMPNFKLFKSFSEMQISYSYMSLYLTRIILLNIIINYLVCYV